MGKQELDNLVKIRRLKTEPPTHSEYAGMFESARKRLIDAHNEDLDPDSRYGAAHRLALAALRREGYRSEDRVAVFQTLAHTLGTDPSHIQTFLKAHNERNLAEYQGRMEIDAKLLAALLRSTKYLEAEVGKLAPPPKE